MPHDHAAFAVAQSLSGLVAPPMARLGAVPLVTTNESGEHAGLLALDSDNDSDFDCSFGAETLGTWDHVLAQLPFGLPVMTASLRQLEQFSPAATYHAFDQDGAPPATLRGTSYGAAFAIAQTSLLLGVTPPEHVLALGVLLRGRMLPVDGLASKLRIAIREAPGLTTVLVADEQLAEATVIITQLALSENSVVAFGVASLEALLDSAYPDLEDRALTALLRSTAPEDGMSTAALDQAISALENMVCDASRWIRSWKPLEVSATQLLLHTVSHLDERRKERLDVVIAIARAHQETRESISVEIPVPSASALRDRPLPVRLGLAAHITQHAHDSDRMSLDRAIGLADELLEDDVMSAHYRPHFRLRMTQCRAMRMAAVALHDEPTVSTQLLAVLAMQRSTAEQIVLSDDDSAERQLSFVLSECYLIGSMLDQREGSAILASTDAFRRLHRLVFDGHAAAYLDFARCRCALIAGDGLEEHASRLAKLIDDRSLPLSAYHLSAKRWLARFQMAQGDDLGALATLAGLDEDLQAEGEINRLMGLAARIDRWECDGRHEATTARLHSRLMDDLSLPTTVRSFGMARVLRGRVREDALVWLSRYLPV